MDASLFLALMGLIGAALAGARIFGTRHEMRRISDVKLQFVAAVLLLSPGAIPAVASIEAEAATERVHLELTVSVTGWLSGMSDSGFRRLPPPPQPS